MHFSTKPEAFSGMNFMAMTQEYVNTALNSVQYYMTTSELGATET